MSYHKTGLSHSRIDNIYKSMIDRCHNPRNHSFHKYGAKGISVCDEWKSDKTKFFEWSFNHGYADGLSIDRIDPSKGYSPENCRWTDWLVQNNHRCSNKYLEINGVTHTIAEWSRISGIKAGTIQYRITKGWTSQEAVFKTLIPPQISGAMATKR